MAVIKCSQGHYYDDSKFDECPHCKNGLEKKKKESYVDDLEKLKTQIGVKKPEDDEKTVCLEIGAGENIDTDKTIGFYNFESGTELVTGWLVSMKGPSRGRDYKLFHGWNRIGRGSDMDVYISDDRSISLQNQASIVFDDKKSKFYLVNEESSLTYLNGVHTAGSTEIKTGDKISMGNTELIFIAFCTEERKWEEDPQ